MLLRYIERNSVMKRFKLHLCALLAFIILSLNISCSTDTSQNNTPIFPTTQSEDIQKLEGLIKSQTSAIEKYRKELEELKNTISSISPENTTSQFPSTKPTILFTYELNGNNATITGFYGTDKKIIIPSHIDGYKVISISDSCDLPKEPTEIVISDGIERIGWFAFSNCTSLLKILIPSSVISIGHSAFGDFSDRITIYCPSGSFAESYAKSYGIHYEIS